MATPTVVFAVAGEGKVSTSTLTEMLADKVKSAGGKPLFYLPLCDSLGSDAVVNTAEVCSEKRWSYIAVTDDSTEGLEDTPEEISRWVEGAAKVVVSRKPGQYLVDALEKSRAPEKFLLLAYDEEDAPGYELLHTATEKGIVALDLTTGLSVLSEDGDEDAPDDSEVDEDDFEEDDEEDESPGTSAAEDDEDDFEEEEDDEPAPRKRPAPKAPASRARPAAPVADDEADEAPEGEDPGAWRAYLDRLVAARDKEMLYALGKPLGILPARGLRLPRLAEMILEAKLGKGVTTEDAEKARPARARKAPEAKATPTPAPAPAAKKAPSTNREAALQLIRAALLLLED